MAKLAINGASKAVPEGLQKGWPPINQDDIDAVVKVLRRGVLWGPLEEEVLGLQKEFSEYVKAKHALVVNSGTAALHACVVAAGIGPGDEVITPAYSFWATSQAVLAHNGIPVFVDIDPDSMNMDPKQIEAKITKKTKALLPVHVHGLCGRHGSDQRDRQKAWAQGHRGRGPGGGRQVQGAERGRAG